MTMFNEIDFSIIIPVYNTGSYLKRCILSLRKQSNAQIEIVLVDDGSTDGTAELCDDLAEQNDGIVVVHQKNSGPGIARNTGIAIAKGRYIIFCDSDDFWTTNIIDFLHEVTNKVKDDSGIDVFVFNGKTTYTDEEDAVGFEDFDFLEKLQPIYTSGQHYLEHALSLKYDYKWFPFLYIFNKQLFFENAIYFPSHRLGEDTATIYKLLLAAKKICILNKPIYIYSKERNDSCSRVESFEVYKGTVELAEKCIEDVNLKEIPEDLKKLLCNNFSLAFFNALIHLRSIEKYKQKSMLRFLKSKKHMMDYAVSPKQVLARKVIRILGMNITSSLLDLRRKVRRK